MGFLKAGSKISLITAALFAAALGASAMGWFGPGYVADLLLGVLLAVFAIRFGKGRKFMPAGLMAIMTLLAIILRRLL